MQWKIKYVAVFDYIDQVLIVLSATSDGVSIISFTAIVGAPVGIASACLTSFFSLITEIIKNHWIYQEKKRKSIIKILCWLKGKINRKRWKTI